jgi:hypothetical protein
MSNVKYEGKKYRIKNQMYPFLIEDLKKWEIPKADIKAQIWAKHGERFAAVWLSEHTISETGRKLINKAETIYRYFYLHFNEVAWPKFEIRNWDAGWWQIKMALNDAGLAQELLEELYVVHKELGDEIKPLIYKYQFLEPDMRDVNV